MNWLTGAAFCVETDECVVSIASSSSSMESIVSKGLPLPLLARLMLLFVVVVVVLSVGLLARVEVTPLLRGVFGLSLTGGWGNRKRTDVPRNLSCPTTLRKSSREIPWPACTLNILCVCVCVHLCVLKGIKKNYVKSTLI